MKEPFIIDARYQNLKGSDQLREYERDKLLYEQAKQLEEANELERKRQESDLINEVTAEINAERQNKLNIQKVMIENASKEKKEEYVSILERLNTANRDIDNAYRVANIKYNLLYNNMGNKIRDINDKKDTFRPFGNCIVNWFSMLILGGFTWIIAGRLGNKTPQFEPKPLVTIIVLSILILYPLITIIHNTKIRNKHKSYEGQMKKLIVDIPDVPRIKRIEFIQDLDNVEEYEKQSLIYSHVTIPDYLQGLNKIYEENKNTTFSYLSRDEYYKIED